MDKIYSINEISKLCNLTRKQLLYYEEKGLIKNVIRGENNYRYYTKEHVAKLVFMKEFREIGFSVEVIDDLLENSTTTALKPIVHQAMASAKLELEQNIAKYQRSMDRYYSLLEAVCIADNHSHNTFELVQVPEKKIISITYEGKFDDESFLFYQNFAKLDTIIKKHKLTQVSARIFGFAQHFDVISEQFLNQDCKIQLIYEVKEDAHALHCPYFSTLPSFEAVYSVCVGKKYDDLKKQYFEMIKWGKRQGYNLADISYEDTLLDIGFADFWVSKLYIPIV